MESWKLVLDETAFQFFVSAPATDRSRLLSAFGQLCGNPHRQADHYTHDATGRRLSVWAARPLLITYWLDSFHSEVRIVNVQRIRF
jgi:hypothetical protein